MKNIIRIIVAFLFLTGPTVIEVSAAYKLPWADTVTWEWWSRSPYPTWHDNCQSNCAIDLGTSGNYKEVVAIEGGTITAVCNSTNTSDVFINHGGVVFGYFHLDRITLEANIYTSSEVVQGQLLGKVKIGSFTENSTCGYTVAASQQPMSGHLHFQMPIPATYVFDGWSLAYANTYMTKNGINLSAGNSFTSTNPMIIKGETINVTKNYSTKNAIVVKDETFINGTGNTIIINIL